MKKRTKLILPAIIITVIILLALFYMTNSRTRPINLRTEYLVNPIGIGTSAPRFTWEYESSEEGFTISDYKIMLGTSPNNLQPYQEGVPLRSHSRYYWNVTVWDQKGRQCKTSETTWFETAKLNQIEWNAQWITDGRDKELEPAPLLRKSFTLENNFDQARIYVAAAGYYEMYINGERVGEDYLTPGYTHFDKRTLYNTYDVTPHLKKGDNVIAVVLGNGWYNIQSKAVWDFERARWRDRPRFLCELMTFDKKREQANPAIMTDASWRTTTGPYTYNNLYSGDMYDARLEESGWTDVGFDDAHWDEVVVTEAPSPLIVAEQMPGIRVVEELKPTEMNKFSDTLYVYSFSKNIAGLPRLKVKGEKGTHITLKHGELLKNDGRLEQGNIDVYYHPEKPYEVFQMDVYTLKGTGEEVFMPSFTYHGFQYIEVESTKPITLTEESVTALFMHTDVEPVGHFSCSEPLLNKIWDATMQAYRSNLHSIPTDCPQREKNGWTADAHIAIDLALLGFDGITVYEKWMNDFIDNQREAGDISGIIPSSSWGYGEWPGPVWDAALFIIPNALYNYYGDTRCIETMLPTMERYLEYLKGKETDGGYLKFGLGDWVYWNATTNNEYTSTAYYYYDYVLMARFARLLGGYPGTYEKKAESLKELINAKFFDPETGIYAEGTQTAQALALYLGLVPEGKEQLVAEKLRKAVIGNDYFLDFGLLGSKTVPAMLTKYGYVEDAMLMITKTDAPSWGYWVETMGYTTLPETWTLSPQFRDASLNHVFMGDVSAWMMNQLAGINYDELNAGFSHIRIAPHFVKKLDWAKGEYKSVRGLITSEWERQEDHILLKVTIPAGCTAEINANGQRIQVKSGSHEFRL